MTSEAGAIGFLMLYARAPHLPVKISSCKPLPGFLHFPRRYDTILEIHIYDDPCRNRCFVKTYHSEIGYRVEGI